MKSNYNIPRLAMSRDEVAVSIGVSPGSIDKMVEEGVLPKPKVWHTRKLWSVSEIEIAIRNMNAEGEARGGFFDAIGQ